MPESHRRSPYAAVPDGLIRHWYFALLLFLAPVQSILLTSVQGSTPAFLLTLGAGGVLFGNDRRYARVLAFYVVFVMSYAAYMALSLSGFTIDQPDMTQLIVIREVYVWGYLKQTHLTQGAYLFTALLFFFIVYQYWQEAFLKWAFYGIIALALYGFYEFIFYAITGDNGDFLSNRNFGDLSTAAAGADGGQGGGIFATGSQLQQSNLFGPNYMRLKSLVGEPSMYALSVTPFAVYAYGRRWWAIFALLLASLVLSTSTTALLGLAAGLSWIEMRHRQEAILYVVASIIIGALLYFTAEPVQRALDTLLFEKLDSVSGNDRLSAFLHHAVVPFDGNPMRFLFGLGFGTVRSGDMLSNLLANVGVIGFLLYSALLLAPCFLMRGADRIAVAGTLLAIYIMEMITVPEYAYLPPWFKLAMAYARVSGQKRLLADHRPSVSAGGLPVHPPA